MSFVALQRNKVIKASLCGCFRMVAIVTCMCRSVPENIYFINYSILKNPWTSPENFQTGRYVQVCLVRKSDTNAKLLSQKYG